MWVVHYLDYDGTSAVRKVPVEPCHHAEDVYSAQVPTITVKSTSPASLLVFLGLELDTMAMEVRLPKPKLECTKSLVLSWLSK